MSYSKTKHDIGFLRQDGSTEEGFMLAQDKNGVPQYQVLDDEYLAEQQFSSAGYSALPPEKEIALRQEDWRSGFGLETYDPEDPKRYEASYGMDLRHRGMAIAGSKATAVTLPTLDAPTITNANMETESSGWTNGARSSTEAHGGTYSWLQTESDTTYQDLATTQIKGRRFTFTMWVWSTETDPIIQIDDGVGTSSSSAHSGSQDWEQ